LADNNGPHATIEQIEQALQALTDADWMKLRSFASSQLWKTGIDDRDELLNETIRRLADGDRNWPINVPFVPFLMNAMRSVADGLRGLKSQTSVSLASSLADPEDCFDDDPMDRFASEAATPEDILIAEAARKDAAGALAKINAHFSDDEEVGWILMGIEDETKPEDVREMSGMSLTQYETGRKRLRRGIARLFSAKRKA
jgi:hypothetical protein